MTSFLKKSNNLTNPKKQFHIGLVKTGDYIVLIKSNHHNFSRLWFWKI